MNQPRAERAQAPDNVKNPGGAVGPAPDPEQGYPE